MKAAAARPAAGSPLLTIDEVAEQLRVSVRTVYAYCDRGDLEFVKLNHKVLRFRQEWIDEMIERKQRGERA